MNLNKLIENVGNFKTFHEHMASLKDNNVKGNCFEQFAKLFFIFDHRYSNIVENCWLLNELPTKIREKLEIPIKDIGIDLIIQTKDKEFWAVQVKFRSNINTIIKWKELSTFFGLTFGISQQFAKGIFFTNTLIPNNHITKCKNTINILHHFLDTTSEQTFKKMRAYLSNKQIPKNIIYKPRPYQQSILEKGIQYYRRNDIGRLYMPCGTGKTLVSFWLAMEQEDKMLICIAVPSLYLLSQVYNTWSYQLENYKFLLIGSDAEVKLESNMGLLLTTGQKEIKDFLEKYEDNPIIVITTYQSSKRFLNACEYEIDFCIFDEAHKTVGSKDRSFSCLLTEPNIKKRLFVTATERVYQGNNETILSMDDKKIYGDVISTYSLKRAIDEGHLTDYLIVAPIITDETFWNMLKANKMIFNKKIKKDAIQSRYYMTAYLLARSIKERGLTHILTFNNTNANAKKFHKILKKMLVLYGVDCNCYRLTGKSTMKERHRVINDFKNDDVAVISSSRIFTEGVDIPIVDSVCFVDNKLSVIDIIQSCGRALRLHNNKELSYIILPTICEFKEKGGNVFELSNKDFSTVKQVLKAMGTIDKRIIEQFTATSAGRSWSGKKQFVTDTIIAEKYGELEISVEDFDDKINITICDRWGEVNWERSKELLFEYCNKYETVPSHIVKYKNKNIGKWLHSQKRNIASPKNTIYQKLAENSYVKESLDIYLDPTKLFDKWKSLLFEYCNKFHKVPTGNIIFEGKKIGIWFGNQKKGISSVNDVIYKKLAKNPYVKESLDNYLDPNRLFNKRKSLLFEYCDNNNKIPYHKTKFKGINIGFWFYGQKSKIESTDDEIYQELAENPYIKEALDKYLIKKNNSKGQKKINWDEWKMLLFEYCNKNHKVPTNRTQYKNRDIAVWLHHQKSKIESIDNEIYQKLAKNPYVKKSLDYYLNPDKLFDDRKSLLFEYCDRNQEMPSNKTIYKNCNIGKWFHGHKKKIKSTHDAIYRKLTENIYVKESLDNYLDPNKLFNEWKSLLFEYCDIEQTTISNRTKYKGKNIGIWLGNQKQKIKSTQDVIYQELAKNPYIKQSLDNYLKFKANNKRSKRLEWNEGKSLLFEYCDRYQKVPLNKEKYKEIRIGAWLSSQKNKIKSTHDDVYQELSVNSYVKESLDNYLASKKKRVKRLNWDEGRAILFEYCDKYQKTPSYKEKYKGRRIGTWLADQKFKINSTDDEIYKKLATNSYVKESVDYYLNPNKLFSEWRSLLFEYCDQNQHVPHCKEIYKDKNVGQWLSRQKKKLCSREDDIYLKLSENPYVKESLDKYLEKKQNKLTVE